MTVDEKCKEMFFIFSGVNENVVFKYLSNRVFIGFQSQVVVRFGYLVVKFFQSKLDSKVLGMGNLYYRSIGKDVVKILNKFESLEKRIFMKCIIEYRLISKGGVFQFKSLVEFMLKYRMSSF